jgi:hypothetical protein
MKKVTIFLVVFALAFSLVPVAFADDGTGTVTVNGAGYSVNISDFDVTFSLDGGDLSDTFTDFAGESTLWQAIDMSGTGNGWNLVISATDFTCQAGPCSSAPTTPVNRQVLPLLYNYDKHTGGSAMAMLSFKMPDADITWVDGQWNDGTNDLSPDSIVDFEGYKALTNSEQQFVTAAEDEGMGTYNFDPDFEVWIPAEMYAGTYTTTVTVTIDAGPTYTP